MRYVFSCFALLYACLCTAQVSVDINQQKFVYQMQPRLADVLRPVAYEQPWYWPAARLYRLNTNKVSELRSEIINKLKFIQADADKNEATLVAALIEQITSWRLAERILINLDYELAQTKMERNPRFDNGEYKLELLTRPTDFMMFGAFKEPLTIPLNGEQCLHEYVHQAIAELQNKDYVYLIKPNGEDEKIAVAYWNAGCVDVTPGSQIFLPFDESQFFGDMAKLNAQIIELTKHRLM